MSRIQLEMGRKIRIKRKDKNYSTADLAKALNVSTGLINNLENGKSDIFKLDLLCELSKELDIPITDILAENISPDSIVTLDNSNLHIQVPLPHKSDLNIELLQLRLSNIINEYFETVAQFSLTSEAIEYIADNLIQHLKCLQKLHKL